MPKHAPDVLLHHDLTDGLGEPEPPDIAIQSFPCFEDLRFIPDFPAALSGAALVDQVKDALTNALRPSFPAVEIVAACPEPGPTNAQEFLTIRRPQNFGIYLTSRPGGSGFLQLKQRERGTSQVAFLEPLGGVDALRPILPFGVFLNLSVLQHEVDRQIAANPILSYDGTPCPECGIFQLTGGRLRAGVGAGDPVPRGAVVAVTDPNTAQLFLTIEGELAAGIESQLPGQLRPAFSILVAEQLRIEERPNVEVVSDGGDTTEFSRLRDHVTYQVDIKRLPALDRAFLGTLAVGTFYNALLGFLIPIAVATRMARTLLAGLVEKKAAAQIREAQTGPLEFVIGQVPTEILLPREHKLLLSFDHVNRFVDPRTQLSLDGRIILSPRRPVARISDEGGEQIPGNRALVRFRAGTDDLRAPLAQIQWRRDNHVLVPDPNQDDPLRIEFAVQLSTAAPHVATVLVSVLITDTDGFTAEQQVKFGVSAQGTNAVSILRL